MRRRRSRRGTQVLLKVKAAGVCHSDLHIWEGGYDLGHGSKPLSLKDRGVSLPRTMGHETVGEVLAFGPDAKTDTGGLKVGDVVLVYPWLGCGKCETCLGGDENMCVVKPNAIGVYCDGGYADHMTVPHPKYLINLKGLDPVTAAPYACSGVTTYSALKKVEKDLNTPIVIFGAGGLGLMALSLLEGDGRQGRHRRRYRCAQARSRHGGRRARNRRRQGARRAGATDKGRRRPDPRRDRSGRQCRDRATRLRLPDQGRQARDRRPVRRRRAMGAAADPDQGDHHPGQLCRQSARDQGTARSRPRARRSRRSR